VLCDGKEKKCILSSKICDGTADCPDSEDEKKCPGSCVINASSNSTDKPILPAKKMIECADGKSYDWKIACGGAMSACEQSCAACNPETAFTCKSNSSASGIKCVHRSEVILQLWVLQSR